MTKDSIIIDGANIDFDEIINKILEYYKDDNTLYVHSILLGNHLFEGYGIVVTLFPKYSGYTVHKYWRFTSKYDGIYPIFNVDKVYFDNSEIEVLYNRGN